ncbi:MAG: hypothetical protein ACRCUE_17245, partial [Bosea sp. (in: a-proteobacteria)]
PRDRLTTDAPGPYRPVDVTPFCLAAHPEADVGRSCSKLAMQVEVAEISASGDAPRAIVRESGE